MKWVRINEIWYELSRRRISAASRHRATIPLAVRPTERGDGNEPAASPALKAAGA